MIEEFIGRAGEYLQHSPHLAVLAVFVGGVLKFTIPVPIQKGHPRHRHHAAGSGRRDHSRGRLLRLHRSEVIRGMR